MNTTKIVTTAAVATEGKDNAVVIKKPKKSKYQFFVRTDMRSGVAQKVRELVPPIKSTDPKKVLIFGYDHPYVGWAGFNLPGTFETRKKLAGLFFSQGWKLGVGLELNDGGLAPIMNRHDHTGCKELPDNTGGCAGCENKNPENCTMCPMDYKYKFDGSTAPKVAFDRNTIWKTLTK